MPIKLRKIRILCLVVWLCALVSFSLPTGADITTPTGKPLLDFYTVYGAIDSVKIINELCNTHFPEYTQQNDLAYKSWRSRYKDFLYKIEQYNQAIITKTSKGNDDAFTKQIAETLLTYENNKTAMHKMFSDFGANTYRASCSAYPEYLSSPKADMANYYKEHIQVFERHWANQK